MLKMVDVFTSELSAKNLFKVRTNDFYRETCGYGGSKYSTRGSSSFTLPFILSLRLRAELPQEPNFMSSLFKAINNLRLIDWVDLIHQPYSIDHHLQLTNIRGVLNLLKVEHLVFLLFFCADLNMLSCLSEATAAQQQKILPDQYSKHDTYSFANIMEDWPTLHKPNDANKGLKPLWAILQPFTIQFVVMLCF